MACVYVLVDPVEPQRVRYVGLTRGRPKHRLWHHVYQAMKGGGTYSANWIRSLVTSGRRPEMRVLVHVDAAQVNAVEQAWIAHFRGTGHRLTNITDGGEGHTGQKRPEHLAKIAAWHTGRKRPAECGARIRAALTGRTYGTRSAAHCDALRAAMSRPEWRDAKTLAMKRLWSTPEYRERLMAKRAAQPKPNRKLTIDAARDIRRQHVEGVAIRELARRYGVTPPAIRALLRNETYRETKVA